MLLSLHYPYSSLPLTPLPTPPPPPKVFYAALLHLPLCCTLTVLHPSLSHSPLTHSSPSLSHSPLTLTLTHHPPPPHPFIVTLTLTSHPSSSSLTHSPLTPLTPHCQIYGRPTIVINYPKGIKAFYMKLNDDNETVAAMDILVPKIGELIGGSQRYASHSISPPCHVLSCPGPLCSALLCFALPCPDLTSPYLALNAYVRVIQ